MRLTIRAKVGPDEAAAPAGHMTVRALALCKKDGFTALGISGQRGGSALSLQASNVSHSGLYRRLAQTFERRHTGSGNALRNNPKHLLRRKLHYLRIGHNIRGALASGAIESMAADTIGCEYLRAIRTVGRRAYSRL
jgi:hypothetical protein